MRTRAECKEKREKAGLEEKKESLKKKIRQFDAEMTELERSVMGHKK